MKPNREPRWHPLCRQDDLAQGESREFALPGEERRSVFAVAHLRQVKVYLNACPHTGAPLNWGADQFLSFDRSLIQCSLHGAQFRIDDGVCIWGPCLRQRLTAVPVRLDDEWVTVDLGTLPQP